MSRGLSSCRSKMYTVNYRWHFLKKGQGNLKYDLDDSSAKKNIGSTPTVGGSDDKKHCFVNKIVYSASFSQYNRYKTVSAR